MVAAPPLAEVRNLLSDDFSGDLNDLCDVAPAAFLAGVEALLDFCPRVFGVDLFCLRSRGIRNNPHAFSFPCLPRHPSQWRVLVVRWCVPAVTPP